MQTQIICEIGLNANGDINIAKKLIDVCSDLNIPYVKFQKRTIEDVYTKEFLDSPRESPWGKTQRAQKEAIEFSLEDYQEIDKYCKKKGNIDFFVSPWDTNSINFLLAFFSNMSFLKIPSAKLNDIAYLTKCRDSRFDLIMSTGMCDLPMVQKAMGIVGENVKYILGCTSSYPTPTKDVNLNQLKILNYYYGSDYKIGWSDHSGGVLFPTLSTAFGAKMVEVHITLDRRMYGSDQASSIEPQGLRHLVKSIEEIEVGLGESIKEIKESELPIIKKLRG